jgi:8-oxo-dGTP pyrophosphatase MutT (NUDIX family)
VAGEVMKSQDAHKVRRYTAAGGIVATAEGSHILALLRLLRPGPDGRAEVRLPKGHIEPEENSLEAALREVSEEAGLSGLEVLGDLGQQIVEFTYKGRQFERTEQYFLLGVSPTTEFGVPERQFSRLWLGWDEAAGRMSYPAEKEWVRRARQRQLRSDP